MIKTKMLLMVYKGLRDLDPQDHPGSLHAWLPFRNNNKTKPSQNQTLAHYVPLPTPDLLAVS